MDDEFNPIAAFDTEPDDPVVASRWSALRWLPAALCGFVGMNAILLGTVTGLGIVRLVRDGGWRAFERGGLNPGLSLVAAALGVLLFVCSGVSAVLASSSWIGHRWGRAALLTSGFLVLALSGAFFLGYSRVVLNASH